MINTAPATVSSSLAVLGVGKVAGVVVAAAPASPTGKAAPSGDGAAFSLAIAGAGDAVPPPSLPTLSATIGKARLGDRVADEAVGDETTGDDIHGDDRQDVAPIGTALPPTVADPLFAWLPPVIVAPPPVATAPAKPVSPTAIAAPGVPVVAVRSETVEAEPLTDQVADKPTASVPASPARPQPVQTMLASTAPSRPETVDVATAIPVATPQAVKQPGMPDRSPAPSVAVDLLAVVPAFAAAPASASAGSTTRTASLRPTIDQPSFQQPAAPQLQPLAANDQPALVAAPTAWNPTAPLPGFVVNQASAATPPVAPPTADNDGRAPLRLQPEIAIAPVAIAAQPADPVRPVTGTTAPAFEMFGAIRAAAARDDRKPDALEPAPLATAAPVELRHAVTATGGAQQAPLDMSNGRWPHAMVDRIEQLRDAANAQDTTIRLVPDALGSIQVSVKQEGATLHVHFAAEQAATATLIQDAQPRLAAIAQERGLTLGQSAVDTGTAGQGWGQQRHPAPAPRFTAAPASAASTDDNDPATTSRLA